MALDVRRYQQARQNQSDNMSISTSTFPGLVVLGVGLVVIVVGIILLAAFGVPKDLNENLKPLSGVIVLCIGALIFVIGICVSAYLKKKRDERLRQRKIEQQQKQHQQQRQQQQQQQQHQHQRQEPHQQLHVSAHGYQGHHDSAHPAAPANLYGNSKRHDAQHGGTQHYGHHNSGVATVYS